MKSNKAYVFDDANGAILLAANRGEVLADAPLLGWREAKKAMRNWYLSQARALRHVSELDYFQND